MSDLQSEIYKRDEEIRRLKFELSKWTEQQKGRKPKLTEEKKNLIKKMKSEGKSNRAIAKEIGVSEKTIRNRLK